MDDWIYGTPSSGRSIADQEPINAQLLAANPAAAAVSDDEAEAFMAVAYLVRTATPELLRLYARVAGVRFTSFQPAARKLTIRAILRRWRYESVRSKLLDSLRYVGLGENRFTLGAAEAVTWENFAELYYWGVHPLLVVRLIRMHGWGDEVPTFLEQVHPNAARLHRIHLDIARIKLREIVYGESAATAQSGPSGGAAANLTRKLSARDALLRSLAADQREAQQARRSLRGAATRTEQELAALVGQARQEVEEAVREVRRRRELQQRELSEAEDRHRQRLRDLERRLAEAQRDHLEVLGPNFLNHHIAK